VRKYFETEYNMDVHVISTDTHWIARIRDRENQYPDSKIIFINSNVISDENIHWEDIIIIYNSDRIIKPRSGNRNKKIK
jgi:disulfide oxidoreductase YuzD